MTENIPTYTYLRTAGEKCKLYELNKLYYQRNDSDNNSDNDSDNDGGGEDDHYEFNINDYPGIQYGDIIYEPHGYRSLNSFIFADAFKNLSNMGPGNGTGGIDSYITKNIEDPISFFGNNWLMSVV